MGPASWQVLALGVVHFIETTVGVVTLGVVVGRGAECRLLDPVGGKADILQLPLHEVVLEAQLPLLPLRVGQVLLHPHILIPEIQCP